MTRYDPDGNPKRRAKKGEDKCNRCVHRDQWTCECRLIQPDPAVTADRILALFAGMSKAHPSQRACRADDYAGDCRHYKPRGVTP